MHARRTGVGQLEIVGADTPELTLEPGLGAVELLGASLAVCTACALETHARNVLKLPVTGLVVRVAWSESERPSRVSGFRLDVSWPELPESRLDAVKRVVRSCTVHRTLEQSPEIAISASSRAGERPAPAQ
jgi:uncharacterized OsmC-like protein